MAISINHLTKVIFIPKNDLTLVQSTPTEILELDLVTFHHWLRDWEDDVAGMVMPTTHNYNPPVSVGGVTLASVIEIINDYTVTFEDGQYAVNLTGANSNVGDRVNVNQVSVRSANSAGLVQTKEIQYASFENGVTVDITSHYSGTLYPVGTKLAPVNNLTDAKLIAQYYGFNTIYILGSIVVGAGHDFTNFVFVGQNANLTTLSVDAGAYVQNCTFRECTLTGTLDGGSLVRESVISNLYYVNGVIHQCMVNPGTITLGGTYPAHFLSCYSGVPGSSTPTINFNGFGAGLAMRGYEGGILLTNKHGMDPVSIDLASGQVKIDLTSVTNGEIVVRGDGKVVNAANGDWLPSGTYGNMTLINETSWGIMLQELWTLQGLDPDNPMTVTPTSRVAANIDQVISGDGQTSSTVTRQ
jgi:hypothetical protein